MKNFIKIAPMVVALTLISCKKEQTADQLVIEQETTQVAQPTIDSQEDMVKVAQSKPLTNIVLSEGQFDFGKIKKGEQKEHTYEITNMGENPLMKMLERWVEKTLEISIYSLMITRPGVKGK